MKLPIKKIFLVSLFLLSVSGCSGRSPKEHFDPSSGKAPHANSPAALIIDDSSGTENGFNQAALSGLKIYSEAAGVTYKCYNSSDSTPDSCKNAVLAAIQDHAELILCTGAHFEQAVGSLQVDYSNIFFLLLDGVPRDSSGNVIEPASNVHCITYREEEAGYLAGYMAVLEGYRNLGFIGGEKLSSVERYGYGFLLGINDAASALAVSGDVHVEYWYAETFSPNEQIEKVSFDWYQKGTEIIFACGGALYQSVLSSAQACDGMLIGADVDQSDISDRFLTSAMKGIDSSIIVALDDFFASGKQWPDTLAGKAVSYGAKENCMSLPVRDQAWLFKTATSEDYSQVLARLKSGAVKIPVDTDTPPETDIAVTYHDQQEENS